ncbi:hypothetical protein ACGLWX_09700 [Halomonas sp. HMF6819]|uniref:hypothetical protein n=1 Tax=Halomonas sp. HMF6819 TaxID=3373085 RepID=UPI0037945C09
MGDDEIFEEASNDFWPRVSPFAEDLKASTQWMMQALAIVRQGHTESTGAAQTATEKASAAGKSAEGAAASQKEAASSAADAKQDAERAAKANTESQAARDESQAAEHDAKQWRDQARQLVTGDVPITSLKPGTLTRVGDYPSTDEDGALVVRNLPADVRELLTSGEERVSASGYDVTGGDPGTPVLNLAKQQVFEFDNPTSLILEFYNLPMVNRSKPIIVRINGEGSVAFDFGAYRIDWENGGAENKPPRPKTGWTTWRFMFTGTSLSGGNFGG